MEMSTILFQKNVKSKKCKKNVRTAKKPKMSIFTRLKIEKRPCECQYIYRKCQMAKNRKKN